MSKVYVVAGLGFGDEGKGTIVDFLCRTENTQAVVRYNGGPQAAHHVVLEDFSWHCFSQFAAGSYVKNMHSHLAHSMLVKPSNYLVERELLLQKGLKDIDLRSSMDPHAYIVTPWDAMLGRMEEISRGASPHGSVGMGVGKAAFDRRNKNPCALQLKDLLDHKCLINKLKTLWEQKYSLAQDLINKNPNNTELQKTLLKYQEETNCNTMYDSYCKTGELLHQQFRTDAEFACELETNSNVILEGAQGMLLDYHYGFFPHVTKTDTSFRSAKAFLEQAKLVDKDIHKLGILRAYATRHGAGPFVTQDDTLSEIYPEQHNGLHRWQGQFRVGHFDLLATRYAIKSSGGPDYLALTHLDQVGRQAAFYLCDSYVYNGHASHKQLEKFFVLEKHAGKYIIQAIKQIEFTSYKQQQELTMLLADCKAHSLIKFSGWDDQALKNSKQLPRNLQIFLDYLESEQGLNCPIRILSFGPKASDKLWRT